MSVHEIGDRPIHLGLGASASVEPPFTGSLDWYEGYETRHAKDGIEGRLVSMYTFKESWVAWEMHPHGSEVVLCTGGRMTLHQERPDGSRLSVHLGPGQYVINEPGVWHTADVDGEATAVFITAGSGTRHRPRQQRDAARPFARPRALRHAAGACDPFFSQAGIAPTGEHMEPVESRSDIRTKVFSASPARLFAAMRDPDRMAKWWGPEGFTNTIHTYDFVPGGSWRLTMHGPDGTDYPTENRFVRLVEDQLFEIEHLNGHHFVLTLELLPHGDGTQVMWRQTFDTAEHYKPLAGFVAAANEQNLGRLAAEVELSRSAD